MTSTGNATAGNPTAQVFNYLVTVWYSSGTRQVIIWDPFKISPGLFQKVRVWVRFFRKKGKEILKKAKYLKISAKTIGASDG